MTKRNMKKSDEWFREGELEKKFDDIAEERAITPPEMKPNEIAEELGCSASGSFYKRFRIWKASRQAEMDRPILEVSPKAKEEFKRIIAENSQKMLESCENQLRIVGGALDHAAKLRTAEAERSAAEATESESDLIENLIRVEDERDEGLAQIDKLASELQEMRSKYDRLAGRVDELTLQNDALLQKLDKPPVADGSASGDAAKLDSTAISEAPDTAASNDPTSEVPQDDNVPQSADPAPVTADAKVERKKGSADFAAGLRASVSEAAAKTKAEPVREGPTGPDQLSSKGHKGHSDAGADLSPVDTNTSDAEVRDDGED
ncbi:MAG: hypothetical protein WA954_00945 [Parerythrobacter sp.]